MSPGHNGSAKRLSHIFTFQVAIRSPKVTTLKAQLEKAISEADHLRDDLQVKEGDLSRLKIDAELKWRETSQLRSEVTQARRELENARSKVRPSAGRA